MDEKSRDLQRLHVPKGQTRLYALSGPGRESYGKARVSRVAARGDGVEGTHAAEEIIHDQTSVPVAEESRQKIRGARRR